MAAAETALRLRRELGLDLNRACAEDAWALAEYLRETVEVRPCPLNPILGFIVYHPTGRDIILLAPEMPNAWAEARVLAHEIGHHVATRPTPEQWRLPAVERLDAFNSGKRRTELLAEAFARAFLFDPRPFEDAERDGAPDFARYLPA